KNAIARLQRKRDTTTPETRIAALVPRKYRMLDIIECETVAIELQRQLEVNNNLIKISMVFDVKGSGNLYDERSDETISPDLQELAAQETVVVDRDINVKKKTNPSGPEEAQSNTYIEKAVTSSNVEPSDTLTKGLNKGNIALVTPVVNREKIDHMTSIL
ncbi:38341_t:CDS:2, partial [Gigaspora margarita]